MGLLTRSRWLKSFQRTRPAPIRRNLLAMEDLEARTVPAFITNISVNPNDLVPTEGVGTGNVVIGNFTVSNYNSQDDSDDYSTTIQWGDGTISGGLHGPTISLFQVLGGGNAIYNITAAHTYTDARTIANPYSLTISINDETGPGVQHSQSRNITVLDQNLIQSGADVVLNATVGSPLTNVVVARFTDANLLGTVDDYTATISWDDPAQVEAGTIVRGANGVYYVLGSHTYNATGSPSSAITVNLISVTATATINASATIDQAPVVPAAATVTITEGATSIPAGTPVGSFTDTGGGQAAGLYTATMQFPGAGGPTGLTITRNGTTNTYSLVTTGATALAPAAQTGTYNTTLTVTPVNGAVAVSSGSLVVTNAALTSVNTTAPTPIEGEPLTNVTLFNFADANTSSVAADFRAVIDWGDGATSIGSVVQTGAGAFRVDGSHTYLDETPVGTQYRVTITVTDRAGGSVSAQTALFSVADNTLSNPVPIAVGGTADVRLNDVPLLFFTDGNPFAKVTDYTVTLNWGDASGLDTVGIVKAVGGNQTSATFAVYGSHTYAAAGGFNVSINVTDQGGTTPINSVTTATIVAANLSTEANPIAAAEGIPTAAGLVVGTVYAPGAANAAALSATFDWGDGTATSTTAGATLTVVDAGGGNYNITATPHTYAAFGSYVVTLTVTELGGSTVQSSNVATVANGALAATGNGTFTVQEGLPFTWTDANPIATVTDANPAATIGQLTATIHWGDGTSNVQQLTQPGGVGTPFNVTYPAGHTYQKDGTYQITVVVEDNGGAKATATATFNATTATYSGTALPINAVQNQPLINIELATFTSSNPFDNAGRFYATIDWDDGTPPSAGFVVQDATANPPTFHVIGSHTYTTVGTFTPTITIAKGDPVIILVLGGGGGGGGGSVTVSASPISASPVNVNGIEGVALPNAQAIVGGTIVATFTDAGSSDPVTSYNATITWGNTQITAGTILQSGTTFFVVAPAAPPIVYPNVGNYTFLVTITKPSSALTAFAVGTAQIANANLTATDGGPFVLDEGQLLIGNNANPLITFVDQDTTSDQTHFTASINWGDGSTTVGDVTQPGGPGTTYNVIGTHTYVADGAYTITVTVTDDAGASVTATAQVTVDQVQLVAGPAINSNAVQNRALVNHEVSTFTSPNPFDTAAQFSATINWGDGTITSGTIERDAGGVFHVLGTHTYTSAGAFPVTVEIAEGADVVLNTYAAGTITVSATPLLVLPVQVNGTEGIVLPNAQNATTGTVVATFLDLGTAAPLAAYSAQIVWGNGIATMAGTVLQDGPNFVVVIPPAPDLVVFPNVGEYTFRVNVTKQTGSGSFLAFAIGTAHINNAALTAVGAAQVTGFQQTPLLAVEVGRFLDANPTALLSEYSAMIDWGDGTPMSAATFSQPGGPGTVVIVRGNHTYANPSTPPAQPYAITVFVEDDDGGRLRLDNTAVISASTLTGAPVTINGIENQTLANVVVGYFTDSATAGPISSYMATINWGDSGPTTIGQIVPQGGNTFAVLGTKNYAEAGTYSVSVVITRNGLPGVTVVSQAIIADAPISGTAVPLFAIEGANFTGTVAFFTSANPADLATDFTSQITWGDGTMSPGTVEVNPGGGFRVTAVIPLSSGIGKRYQDEGQYTFSVRINSVDGATINVYEVATVIDAPLSATGITTTAPEWPAFTGIVANFTDANPFAQATTPEHVATINWGDGTTSTGTITQNFTAFPAPTSFTVTGTHLYEPGVYQVTITIRDEGGSFTTALTSITITDSPLTAGTPISITSQEGLPFTGQVATFTDANPLGQISEFSATINWGDGTSSSGIIGQTAAGVFTVTGTHTYPAFTVAPLPVAVSIRSIDGATANVTGSATVTNAPLASEGATIVGVEGNTTGNVIIATFTDANPNSQLAHFTTGGGTITVNWGDGTTETVLAANVTSLGSANGVTYTVRSAHTYLNKGNYQLTVTIRDNGGATTVANGQAIVSDAPLTRAGVQPTITGVEGQTFSGTVFTFIDGNPLSTTADFVAEVNWGNGQIDAGVITQPGGIGTPYNVTTTHFFADSGTYTIGVVVTDIDGSTLSYTATYTVSNVAPTAVIANTGPVNENSPVTVSLTDPMDPSPVDKTAGFRYSFATTSGGLATSYLGASPNNSTQFTFPDGLIPPVGTVVFGRIFDKDGGFTDYSTTVTVLNVAPTATLAVSTPLIPGQPSNVTFSNQFDPSPTDTTAGFTYTFDLGTGTFGAPQASPVAVFTPPGPGTYTIRGRIYDKDGAFTEYVAADPNGNSTITVIVPNVDIFTIGAGSDGGPIVHVFSAATYAKIYSFTAYEPTFRGGVLVAVGDINGDGIPDIVTGTGDGGGPVVKVFAGPLFAEVGSFYAYESTFRGGVLVATADVDGDGRDEIVTGTGIGGGPVVKVFDGTSFAQRASFAAYDITARGGVFVAGGNTQGDAREEIITGAGNGGAPHVKIFSPTGSELQSFFAYEPTVLGGVTVSAGNLFGNPNGYTNIVTGTGVGGDAHLKIWGPTGLPHFSSTFVFGPDKVTGEPLRNGFNVNAKHIGGPNGRPIIIAGAGRDYGPTVRIFDAATMDAVVEIVPFEKDFTGGVYVG